jgi:outer membrane protein TolC
MAESVAPPVASPRLPVLTEALTLTPETAAALAVRRSTALALADQGVLSAQGLVKQAAALNKLTLDLQASYTRTGPAVVVTLPGSTESFQFSPSATHREALSATLPLYLAGRDKYAQQAAGAGVEAAQGSVQGALLSVALSARQVVLAILRLQQVAVVAQQRVTAVAEHLRVTTAMFDQGTTPRFEVVQAETNLATAKGEVIRAGTAVAQAKSQLAALLNLSQEVALNVEEGVPAALPEGDLHQLIQTALQQRPDVQAQEAQVRAREASLRLAQVQQKPTVALQGTVANQTASLAAGNIGWTLSLGMNWPLLDGGATKGGIMVAQAALNSARLNVESTQQQVALQVTQAQLDFQDAKAMLAVAEQGSTNAQERARIAQVRFQNGVGLGVEVLDAQTALAGAETQVIDARYQLQLAVAALRAALGLTDLAKEPTT